MNNIKITINKEKLLKNIAVIRTYLNSKTKLCAVVKCNAYGHGVKQICKIIDDKIDFYAVSNNKEAVNLARQNTTKSILVLGAVSTYYIRPALKRNIILSAENEYEINLINSYAKKLNLIASIHLKVNTGMNRLGFNNINQIKELLSNIAKYPNIKINGVFSHLGSGNNLKRTKHQQILFDEFLELMPQDSIKHLYNSTFYINTKNCYDLVRVGIGLYGYDFPNVSPCLQIEARIVSIRNVRKGEYIGYGNNNRAKRNMRIATIAMGYGQGLPRLWSKNGYVLINGQKAKFCANICMDMSIIDITNISANVNDYVTILGSNKEKEITADIIAKQCKTISYEILTNFKKIA